MKGLADSLILHGEIETTLDKAKETRPYVERLITKAKKGDLHNRRAIIAAVQTREAAAKLVNDIAPKLTARTSGYLRIERTTVRRGDNAQLATVSFVDDLQAAPVAKKAEKKSTAAKTDEKSIKEDETKKAEKKTPAKKPAAKKKAEAKK